MTGKIPGKRHRCNAHLNRPGFGYGSSHCACQRLENHPGPHRTQGRWEWTEDSRGRQTVYDIETGKRIDL